MFEEFPKIARLSRNMVVTEKIDGTNAQIIINDDSKIIGVASRTRLITPDDDNYGFARWVEENREELEKLGPGRHFGEWWGRGINKRYGAYVEGRKFSLFNVGRWNRDNVPACCDVVPVLYEGEFNTKNIYGALVVLQLNGSVACPGCMNPEGVVIWHEAARIYFKKTITRDAEWKGKSNV